MDNNKMLEKYKDEGAFYKTEQAQLIGTKTICLMVAFIRGDNICRKVDNSTYETYPSSDNIIPIPWGEYLTCTMAKEMGYKIVDRRFELKGNTND